MSKINHSNPYKHPGSGGATVRPRSGGADWVPLPEGTWEPVEHCTTSEVPRSGVIGRVLDHVLPPKTETTCTTEVRKNYF
ncbi:MAG: hypothetical protein F2840_07850 [Actinobacteria bacterium]|jgi:hypothetical protein|uniref:Unannotated protein n=1 Tax=freshwater metagenome TaxID=449393 RepID=A0A6J7K767_9ZZZZ|nr:hypothetical protein [Actinomycetota bacterium]